jgi:hypothetical protein
VRPSSGAASSTSACALDFPDVTGASDTAAPEDAAPYTHLSHGRRGGGGAKSSVRSAMFIATRAVRSAKLRRSGTYSCSLAHCRRAKIPVHAAPTELGWASGVVITINMALLTELDRPSPPKMRVRCGLDGRTPLKTYVSCCQGSGIRVTFYPLGALPSLSEAHPCERVYK